MRIQHNVMAMNAYRNYTNNVAAMKSNLEKLSSGYKINRAGDDAAGLAISEKMRAQITGLQTAQKNAKDGISLVQTAEGALTEVHDMLNRMVELATQSANGTYDNDTDRYQLQKEMDQLRSEINRIADSSNFNGINLLDGTMSTEDTAGVTQDINIAKLVGTAAPVGTGTIPHNNPGTETTGTEFEVNLHDVWMNNLDGGELSIKVGDAEIKLAGVTTDTDDEAVVTADKIAKILTGEEDAADYGLEIKSGLTGGTGTDPNTVTIGGQKFNVIAGSDGTSVKFQQAVRPTKDTENVSPQQKVTVDMQTAEGATKTPKLDKVNDDIKNFAGEASATKKTDISLTLVDASTESVDGYVADSSSSLSISNAATSVTNLTANNGDTGGNSGLDIDAILKTLNASGEELGTESGDGDVTISYRAADADNDVEAAFELKVGGTVVGTAAVPENGVAASDSAVLEFKTADETPVSLGNVKLSNGDSGNAITAFTGFSLDTGMKVNTTAVTATSVTNNTTVIDENNDIKIADGTSDVAFDVSKIKAAADGKTGAVTIKAATGDGNDNKLGLFVGNTQIAVSEEAVNVAGNSNQTLTFKAGEETLGTLKLTDGGSSGVSANTGFELDTGYALSKVETEAVTLTSSGVTLGDSVTTLLDGAKDGDIVIGKNTNGDYTVTVGGEALEGVSGSFSNGVLTISVGEGNDNTLATLNLGAGNEGAFKAALGSGLTIGTWDSGEEQPPKPTTVSDSETLFNGELADGADEETALKDAGDGVTAALTTGDFTIGSGDDAIEVDLSALEGITEDSTLGAYATALETALQEAADASEGNIKYENFQVTIGEDGIKVTYNKSVNMPEEITGTEGTAENKTGDFLEDVGLDTSDLTANLTANQVTAFNSGDVKITIGTDFEINASDFGLTTTDTVKTALKKIQDAVNFQFDLHTAEHATDTEPWTKYSNFEFTDDDGNGLALLDAGSVKAKWTETPMNEEEGTGGSAGSTTYDWNPKTTVQKAVEAGDGFRLASTNFELTKDMVDNASITIGKETYKFTTGDKSGVDGNTITLDKNLSGDKLLDKAGELLTQAGKTNAVFSIGYEGGKVQVVEKEGQTGYLKDGKSTLTSFDAISEALSYTTGSKAASRGLTLQIGDTADSYNRLTVSITDCHTSSLGIDKISIGDQESATDAIKSIKDAINKVSDIRGTLGATQNRLDHTINNLSVMTENIQDAESTIRDVDVAEEMMAYTKNNILIQSAQAMLAQANQVPQGVLQLLQ